MKTLLASAALAAAMFAAPSAFAQQIEPQTPPPAKPEKGVILQGTPEAAEAKAADDQRASVELVTAANNGEPVAKEVAEVVTSGKRYTTADLVAAQSAAFDISAEKPVMSASSRDVNATRSPGDNDSVFKTAANSSLRAEARDAEIPAQAETSATAQADPRPGAPAVETPNGVSNPTEAPSAPLRVPPEPTSPPSTPQQ